MIVYECTECGARDRDPDAPCACDAPVPTAPPVLNKTSGQEPHKVPARERYGFSEGHPPSWEIQLQWPFRGIILESLRHVVTIRGRGRRRHVFLRYVHNCETNTEWLDLIDDQDKVIVAVRPEQVVSITRSPEMRQRA
jgi:hypothetical protein